MSNYGREEYTLAAFWETYSDCWCDLEENNLRNQDVEGNEYDWEGGGYIHQVPMYQDFLTIMAIQAISSVFDGNNSLELSREDKRRWNEDETNNLWKLHDELYITVITDYYDGELTFYHEHGNYDSVEDNESIIWDCSLKVTTRDEYKKENEDA